MRKPNNPFAFGRPITPDNLDELFAHHRVHFGGWSMEEPSESEKAAAEKAAADKAAAEAAEKAKEKFEPITSQEEMDRRLGERLARERAKFGDYEDLKKKAAAHDKAIEEARTDQEKAVEAAKTEGRTEALTQANSRLRAAEARALAAEAKFVSPTLAVKALDLDDVEVKDDGSVDAGAIKAKLKELAESGAFVIDDGKGGKRPKPDHSQGGGGGDGKTGGGSVAEVMAERRAAREARNKS